MKTLFLIILLSIPSLVLSAVTFEVNSTLLKSYEVNSMDYGGGCLVYAEGFIESGKYCKPNWVMFDCDPDADVNTKEGKNMFIFAYVAVEKQTKVDLLIRQARRVDGYCKVDRIRKSMEP